MPIYHYNGEHTTHGWENYYVADLLGDGSAWLLLAGTDTGHRRTGLE